ncbi:MAG: cytochrome b/b6 domain-containing protein [Gammaproteobacteria bacterium]|nr:cytochrome b/b6 domain-containing protein [Gammaproteobacteria bacterium]
MNRNTQIKVWDLPVRIFHWSLVACFLIAFITEDDVLALHVLAGYAIAGLLVFRFVWGFIGTRYARFSDFVKPRTDVFDYLKQVARLHAPNYTGHNPAGGMMVIALLVSLTVTTLTGIAVYGAEEMSGPFAGLMSSLPHFMGKAFEELHEFFANFTLLLVVIHVAGVIVTSLLHGENLVKAMINGYKRAEDKIETGRG